MISNQPDGNPDSFHRSSISFSDDPVLQREQLLWHSGASRLDQSPHPLTGVKSSRDPRCHPISLLHSLTNLLNPRLLLPHQPFATLLPIPESNSSRPLLQLPPELANARHAPNLIPCANLPPRLLQPLLHLPQARRSAHAHTRAPALPRHAQLLNHHAQRARERRAVLPIKNQI